MKLKFKSKKEFAEAILKYGKLYLVEDIGRLVCFDEQADTPFINNFGCALNNSWSLFSKEWSTTPPLKDKDLVWAWDNKYAFHKILCFYDAVNNKTFADNGYRDGFKWQNIEKYEGEWPQWAIEAHKKLQD